MIHILDRQTERILDVLVNQSDSKIYWDTKMTEAIEDNVLIFEFRMLADSPAAKHIVPKNKITAQDQDGFHRLFIIDTVEMSHDANGKVLFVSALGDHIELANDEPIPPQTLAGQTAETAVQFVLANTRYQSGQIDFAGGRTISFDTYTNPLAALQKIASVFDLEPRFRVTVNPDGSITRIVDLLKPDDLFDGKEIVFGKDMTGIRRKENTENICTRLVGIGPADEDGNIVTFASVNGGKIYVEDEEAYQRWNNAGRHIWGIFEYQPEGDTEVTPQEVLDATKKEMEKRKNSAVEWEVQAAALEQVIGLEHERVRAGMNVRIKDEAFDPPIYLEARVLETEMPELDDPNGNFSYTFGNYRQVNVVIPPEVKSIQKTLYRNANSWTAAKTIAEKKAQTFEGQTPPTQMNVGDLWYNPASGAFFRWDGSAWILVADETGKNTAADTAKVGGKPSITVLSDISNAQTAANAAQQTANQAKQTADNSVQKGTLYNGVSISDTDGFKVTRSDQLVQGVFNATEGIRFQTRPNTASAWQDAFFFDVNTKKFKFTGHLEGVSGSFSAQGGGIYGGGNVYIRNDRNKSPVIITTDINNPNVERLSLEAGAIYLQGNATDEPRYELFLHNYGVFNYATHSDGSVDFISIAPGGISVNNENFDGSSEAFDITINNGNGNLFVNANLYCTGMIEAKGWLYTDDLVITNKGVLIYSDARHILMTETDNNDKQWHIEVNNGALNFVETNIATRLTLYPGGGLETRDDIIFSVGLGRVVADSSATYIQNNTEIRATKYKSTTYVPVRASSFPTGSLAEYKEDIHPWKESALEKIRNTTIYEYYLKSELEQGIQRKRQGLVIGEGYNTPDGVVDGDGVEQYLLNAWSWKAIQELDSIQLNHEDRIAQLEQKIAELEAKIS